MPIVVIPAPTEQQTIEIFGGNPSTISVLSGGGESLISGQTGSVVTLKGLVAGTGISLTDDATTITISATSPSGLTADRVMITDGSGAFTTSSITPTKLGYLADVTSNIEAQITTKQATITGAATTITSSNLVSNRLLQSDGSGKVAASSIVPSSLGYVTGLTSDAQTQLDAKLPLAGGTLTGTLTTRNIVIPSPYTINLGSGALTIDTSLGFSATALSVNLGSGNLVTTSGGWNNGTNTIRFKVIEIGDWNMDITSPFTVAHTIGDYTKIRSVSAIIRDDAGTAIYPLDNGNGYVSYIDATNISLLRESAGFFDSTSFNGIEHLGLYNRGWVTIMYEI